ncbi:MAG TPA: helix-turn-helix transcriptional regulator [Blastocatellia bacterium]|nr:helix-turn-helix transcriptional regulator [Blastocatellia bacterium]
MSSRLCVEQNFSVEQRIVLRSSFEFPSQPDFLLVHVLTSQLSKLKPGAEDSGTPSFFANPNQSAQLKLDCRKAELLLVRLTPELVIETASRLRLYRGGSQLLFRLPLTPVTEDRRLRQTLEAIAAELETGATGWREMIRSLVNQLTLYLLRAHINIQRSDEIELSRAGLVDRRLRRAIEFMHDNCGKELSLAEIAAAAYLSEFHFARLFKKITGVTPHAYLAAMRIERARQLLAESDLPIVEVGATVGYASQSHFTKVFREATGMTPHAFRQAASR